MAKTPSKRTYQKRNESYWQSRKTEASKPVIVSAPVHQEPVLELVAHKKTVAACGGVGNSTSVRNQWAPVIASNGLYPNLAAGIMPFGTNGGGYYTMSEPINLATLAYFNVPLIHNTINLLRDFSISPLHIKTTNKTVKAFFAKWFEAINLGDFMSQFFLEFYRSGNVFIYQFNGKIAEDKFDSLKTAISAKKPELPIRFIILDPKQVYLQVGPNGDNSTWTRMLSTFELQRLRDPKTPEDVQVLRSMPPEIQEQIKNYSSQPWIYVPLDTSRFYYAFNSKQDYEPLAVPMIFPLLSRVEYKLMLEAMDMSLVQTMEQVCLLVTHGDRADQYNPGPNPKAIAMLTEMFRSQTIGRVLVGDHTLEGKWLIPDLKELLGRGKYEQVNQDIREGLGYFFFGEDKFATAAIKAKLFIESLREGRRIFLNNFLRPQVRAICESMGFKNLPELVFEDIDVQDQTAMQRVYLQMAQLGLLTDTELNQALKTGILPTKEESVENQTRYKKERENDLYFPLIGGDKGTDEQGRPAGGGGAKSPAKKVSPIGTKAGHHFSAATLIDLVPAMMNVHTEVEKAFKKLTKVKTLDESQIMFITAAAKSIVLNEPKEEWLSSAAAYIKDPKQMPSEALKEMARIGLEFPEECAKNPWMAVALYKARTEAPKEDVS